VKIVCKKVLKKWVILYHFVEKEYIGYCLPCLSKRSVDPDIGAQFTPLCPVKFMHMTSEAYFTGACPVKFMHMRSEADLTGVGPVDRTGVESIL